MIITNIFLKQSRRDKTHAVQVTPHKRSAVWGISNDRSAVWGISNDRSAVWGMSNKRSAVWGQLGIILILLFFCAACRERVEPPTPYEILVPKGFPTVKTSF